MLYKTPSKFCKSPKVAKALDRYSGGVLHCPRCGDGAYLHHVRVTTYSRPQEDGPVDATVVEHDGSVRGVAPGEWGGMPATRRDAVVILFYCEGCSNDQDGDLELTLVQDKGQTFAGWRRSRR